MSQYERTKRWKAKNRDKVNANQRAYREGDGKAKAAQARKARVDRIVEWFQEYKSTLSCSRCGEDHPACIQFHHTDPSVKESNVGRMAYRGVSVERIMAEIAKCEVLCANCHAKEHASKHVGG